MIPNDSAGRGETLVMLGERTYAFGPNVAWPNLRWYWHGIRGTHDETAAALDEIVRLRDRCATLEGELAAWREHGEWRHEYLVKVRAKHDATPELEIGGSDR